MTIQKYSFDIQAIVSFLDKFKNDLPTLYSWNANISRLPELGVLSRKEVDSLNREKADFKYLKELRVKQAVRLKLVEYQKTNPTLFNDLCLWIIKDWGGITGAADTNTVELVQEFLNSEKPVFNRIASSSKVGAYLFPKENIIYDSRVAYSLNWILLSKNAAETFFPIPDGRNSKMIAFDMNVLIRLSSIEHYHPDPITEMDNKKYISKKDKSIYIPKNEAYTVLNSLIKEISKKLWSGEKSEFLFYTEMLLFSIADREIFEDITSRLNLTFDQ